MTVGMLSFRVGYSGFNAGRSQINVNFADNAYSEFPFINFIKGGLWTLSDNSGDVLPNTLDSNGYPTSIVGGGVYMQLNIPTQIQKSGRYAITWDATGASTISLTGGTSSATGSLSTAGAGSGRYEFLPTGTTYNIGITTTGVSNLKFFNVNDETAMNNGEYFTPEFKSVINKFGVIRFLNWLYSNESNARTWSDRKSLSYYSWASRETRSSLWAGTATGAATGKLALTFGSGAPIDKQMIHFIVDNIFVIPSVSATFTTGTPGTVNATAHPFNNGDVVCAGNSATPNEVFQGVPYWVVNKATNTFQLALTKGGSAITFSGSPGTTTFTRTPTLNLNATGEVPLCEKWGGGMYNGFGNLSPLGPNASTFTGSVSGTTLTVSANPNSITFNPNRVISDTLGNIPAGTTIVSGTFPTFTLSNNCGTVASQTMYYGQRNCYGTAVYDSDLNQWMLWGGRDGQGSQGLVNGTPIEVCLQLAVELKAHPWFTTPRMALDPMTDYVQSLCTYVKNNSPSWMIPRYEPVNETWNQRGSAVAIYAQQKAWAHWTNFGTSAYIKYDNENWLGKVASTLGQDVNAIYSGSIDSTKYHVIVGLQTNVFTDATQAGFHDQDLSSTLYVAQSAAAQTGYTKDPANKWATHVAPSTYFNSNLYFTGTETTLAANYAGGDNTALTTYADACATGSAGSGAFTIAQLATVYSVIYTWCQQVKFQNRDGFKIRMCAYEGGWSPDTGNGETTQVANLRLQSKFSSDSGKLLTGGTLVSTTVTTGIYNIFTSAGGEFPSQYLVADPSAVWSGLNPDIFQTPSAYWNAIVAYNS